MKLFLLFSIPGLTIRLLRDTVLQQARVSYIRLDEEKISKHDADSLRTVIIREYQKGVSSE
ncbi:hypothetical protein SAMN05421788_101390 [Filimonas lacunae]|uniref:Uncharacterized protein n=1 Tax=Filimonas lacunae TaxID=477680 RepID=A0A1N7KS76_9BACT|nr:hypothetical protein [Filimonas lacunae]SIS64414.1 hypothetical protein SAMN05421788_101390 [Filimonas lacunae]